MGIAGKGREGWDAMGREGWEGCEGMDRKAGMELEGRDGMKGEGWDEMGRVGWGGKGGMERMRLEGSDGIRWKG